VAVPSVLTAVAAHWVVREVDESASASWRQRVDVDQLGDHSRVSLRRHGVDVAAVVVQLVGLAAAGPEQHGTV